MRTLHQACYDEQCQSCILLIRNDMMDNVSDAHPSPGIE
jgi:hypothetical protein